MSQYDDDFWGNDEEQSTGEFESKGGNFEVIPDGTRCKAHIEDVEWKFYDPDGENIPYVNATWAIEAPDDYENRKIFHAIKLYGEDPSGKFYKADAQEKKIESARAIFWAIDKNCGGKLAALKRKPTDGELQRYLIGKSMFITLAVWESADKSSSGNWIRKIEPLSSGNSAPQARPVQKKQPVPQSLPKSGSGFDDMDDDIPF